MLTDFEHYQKKVEGKNINSQTLLATDYINHFNEVHMMIDMLPMMPDCIDDIRQWTPKTYQKHFADSGFAARELAIQAYAYSPEIYRTAFEHTVGQMDQLVRQTIQRLEKHLAADDMVSLQAIINRYSPKMLQLIEQCGAIINGEKVTTHQESIDHYFDDNEQDLDGEDLDQNAIDDLFG